MVPYFKGLNSPCYFQIPQYLHNVESGINTDNSNASHAILRQFWEHHTAWWWWLYFVWGAACFPCWSHLGLYTACVPAHKHGYCILPNKRAGCWSTKRTLILIWFQWNWLCEPSNTLTLIAENFIKISSEVSQIWPDKIKSPGEARLFKQVRLFGKIRYIQGVLANRLVHIWILFHYSKEYHQLNCGDQQVNMLCHLPGG